MFKLLKFSPLIKQSIPSNPAGFLTSPILSRAYATFSHGRYPPRKIPKHFAKLGAIPIQDALDVFRALSIGFENSFLELQIFYTDEYTRPIQGSILLPTPIPQRSKVLVFAEGREAELATAQGVDFVGGEELIAKVQAAEITFDHVLCTPDMYPHVLKIARTLGPLGLMPTPKKGNVTSDIVEGLGKLRRLHKFSSDVHKSIQTRIALLSHTDEQIKQNVITLLNAVFEFGASTVKQGFFKKIVLRPLSGPPIVLEDAFNLVLDYRQQPKVPEAPAA